MRGVGYCGLIYYFRTLWLAVRIGYGRMAAMRCILFGLISLELLRTIGGLDYGSREV